MLYNNGGLTAVTYRCSISEIMKLSMLNKCVYARMYLCMRLVCVCLGYVLTTIVSTRVLICLMCLGTAVRCIRGFYARMNQEDIWRIVCMCFGSNWVR